MNKIGFTLIEMVLVIAIIVILAVVVFFNVAAYLGRAKSATSMMDKHITDVENATSMIADAIQ